MGTCDDEGAIVPKGTWVRLCEGNNVLFRVIGHSYGYGHLKYSLEYITVRHEIYTSATYAHLLKRTEPTPEELVAWSLATMKE